MVTPIARMQSERLPRGIFSRVKSRLDYLLNEAVASVFTRAVKSGRAMSSSIKAELRIPEIISWVFREMLLFNSSEIIKVSKHQGLHSRMRTSGSVTREMGFWCTAWHGSYIFCDWLLCKLIKSDPPEVLLESCTVSIILIKALKAASTSPLCSGASTKSSSKLSRATGVKSLASGGMEVILTEAKTNEPNLSDTTTHKGRMYSGSDPWGIICSRSGSLDGTPKVSQKSFSTSTPNAYWRGKASASLVHCRAVQAKKITQFTLLYVHMCRGNRHLSKVISIGLIWIHTKMVFLYKRWWSSSIVSVEAWSNWQYLSYPRPPIKENKAMLILAQY